MKQHQGVWLPDHEKHMPEWMDKHGELVNGCGTYQIKKLRKALEYCTTFRNAVDVGAHVGFWAMHLQPVFWTVHAFEPVEEHRRCFLENVPAKNVFIYPCALGEREGRVGIMVPPGSSGGSHVFGTGSIPMHPLDHFDFQEVDFLKVDCEGYELMVLRGAEQLLKNWAPVVVVEQKPHKIKDFGFTRPEAVEYLKGLGYKTRAEMGGDYIMTKGA